MALRPLDFNQDKVNNCLNQRFISLDWPNVQAEDDPIAPEAGIPYKQVEANEKCILLVTPAGGHLGWVSGPQAPFGK